MSTAFSLLRWQDLERRFGRRVLFRELTGEARAGEVVAVTGANGSGKSTLLRILAGLLRPSRGRVDWPGAGTDLRHTIGFVAPDLRLYGELSAKENLTFFAALLGRPLGRGEASSRLDQVGLAESDHDKLLARYSSGMAQRVRLAFARLGNPYILVLDEPGSNLDDAGRQVVDQVVADGRRDGLVIIATNDPREAALADRHIHLG